MILKSPNKNQVFYWPHRLQHVKISWPQLDITTTLWAHRLNFSLIIYLLVSVLLYRCTVLDANKTHEEKARWELQKNATYCFEQILEETSHKTATLRPLASHFKKTHRSKRNMQGYCWRSKDELFKWRSSMEPNVGRPSSAYINSV